MGALISMLKIKITFSFTVTIFYEEHFPNYSVNKMANDVRTLSNERTRCVRHDTMFKHTLIFYHDAADRKLTPWRR